MNYRNDTRIRANSYKEKTAIKRAQFLPASNGSRSFFLLLLSIFWLNFPILLFFFNLTIISTTTICKISFPTVTFCLFFFTIRDTRQVVLWANSLNSWPIFKHHNWRPTFPSGVQGIVPQIGPKLLLQPKKATNILKDLLQ